jgi:hypothetical protein
MAKMNSMRRAFFWVLGALPTPLVSKTGKAVGETESPMAGQSAYAQTPAERAAGIIPANQGFPIGDVRRYGALGDGLFDDTNAIQNALNLADSAFGTTLIVFPAGLKFKITAYCQIFSNTSIHLFGEIQLTGRQSGLFMNRASNVGIYGFKAGSLTDTSVQGSYVWNPGSGNIAPAIHVRSSKNVIIDGIKIDHCSQGVFVSNASQNFVINAAFTPTQDYPTFVRIQNCSFTHCEWSGCATLSSYDSGYYDNYLFRCGDGGMWMMGSINGEVIGNHRVSPLAIIADVVIHGPNSPAHPTTWNDVQGLEFENCLNLLISQNVVENFQGEAIDIKQGCNRVMCTSNRIVNSEQYSIVVREGDPGDVNACGKVSIVANTISSHGFAQFSRTPMGSSAAISVSSAFNTDVIGNIIHSFQTTPGVQCLGPGVYQSNQYARNPQQASITIEGNAFQFSGANPYDKSEFPFTAATLGAIIVKGQYTSVACNNNHIRTDRYYFADDRLNASPAIFLQYAEANGSFYPTSANISGNEISGWGSDGIRCIGLAAMPYSGLNVNGNTIGNPGGYGILLQCTNYAVCSNNSVSQPTNKKTSYEAVALLGSAGSPLTGVVCSANSLTGAWNTGGDIMNFCMLIQYARDINLSNNRMTGALKGNLNTTAIMGDLILAGSTGFPRTNGGSPNGSLTSYWRGEEILDTSDGTWWKAIDFQSTSWTRISN